MRSHFKNHAVGTVKNIDGQLKVISKDGSFKVLSIGDSIYPGQTLLTGNNSHIALELTSGELVDLTGNSYFFPKVPDVADKATEVNLSNNSEVIPVDTGSKQNIQTIESFNPAQHKISLGDWIEHQNLKEPVRKDPHRLEQDSQAFEDNIITDPVIVDLAPLLGYSTLHSKSVITDLLSNNIEREKTDYTDKLISVNVAPDLDLSVFSSGTGYTSHFSEGIDVSTGSVLNPVAVAGNDSIIEDANNLLLSSATFEILNPEAGDLLSIIGSLPAGITIDSQGSTDTLLILRGQATVHDFNLVIRQVIYSNASGNMSDNNRQINVVVSDGAADSNVAQTTVIVDINEAAVIRLDLDGTELNFVEGDNPLQLINTALVNDPDNTELSQATVKLTGDFESSDSLQIDGTLPGAIVATYENGELKLQGVATIADYEAALKQVRYVNTGEDPVTQNPPLDGPDNRTMTVTVTVTDANGRVSNVQTAEVTTTEVNDPVNIDLNGALAGDNYSSDFVEGLVTGTSVADEDNSLSDVDGTHLSEARIVITNGQADDTLHIYENGAVRAIVNGEEINGIRYEYEPSTYTLILSGVVSFATYEAALNTIRFYSTSDNPDTTDRVITITAEQRHQTSGDLLDSATATTTISVTGANDAPTYAGNLDFTGIPEDTIFQVQFPSGHFSDSDGDSFNSVRIESLPANGTLATRISNGSAVAVEIGDIINITQIQLGQLIFIPDAHEAGDDYASFEFRVGDGQSFSDASYNYTVSIAPDEDIATFDELIQEQSTVFFSRQSTANGAAENDTELVFVVDTSNHKVQQYQMSISGTISELFGGASSATVHVFWDGPDQNIVVSSTLTQGVSFSFNLPLPPLINGGQPELIIRVIPDPNSGGATATLDTASSVTGFFNEVFAYTDGVANGVPVLLPNLNFNFPDQDSSEHQDVIVYGLTTGTIITDGDNSYTITGSESAWIGGWDYSKLQIIPVSGATGNMALTIMSGSMENVNGTLNDLRTTIETAAADYNDNGEIDSIPNDIANGLVSVSGENIDLTIGDATTINGTSGTDVEARTSGHDLFNLLEGFNTITGMNSAAISGDEDIIKISSGVNSSTTTIDNFTFDSSRINSDTLWLDYLPDSAINNLDNWLDFNFSNSDVSDNELELTITVKENDNGLPGANVAHTININNLHYEGGFEDLSAFQNNDQEIINRLLESGNLVI